MPEHEHGQGLQDLLGACIQLCLMVVGGEFAAWLHCQPGQMQRMRARMR